MAEVQNIVIKDIRLKVGSKEAWQTKNPILLRGQPGYELDTYRNKLGDGTTNWNDLPYQSGFLQETHDLLETIAQEYQDGILGGGSGNLAYAIYTPTLDGPPVPTNLIHPITRKRIWQMLVRVSPGPTTLGIALFIPIGDRTQAVDTGSELVLYGRLSLGTTAIRQLLTDPYVEVLYVNNQIGININTKQNYVDEFQYADILIGFTRQQDSPVTGDAFIGGDADLITRGPAGADGITLDVDDPRVIEHNSQVGDIVAVYGDVPPGTLECDGSLIAIADYPELANHLLTVSPILDALDGLNVHLPDFRGQFLRGIDDVRVIGDAQEDAIRNITGNVSLTANSSANIDIVGYRSGALYNPVSMAGRRANAPLVTNTDSNMAGWQIALDASLVVPTADENRPKNVAVRYCIRYKSSILAGVPDEGGSVGTIEIIEDEVIYTGPVIDPQVIGYVIGPQRTATGADIHICDELGYIIDGTLTTDWFNTHSPWKDIVDVPTIDSLGVSQAMVMIPRYYYKKDIQPDGMEYAGCPRFMISATAKEGFTCDGSVFKDIDGNDVDYFLFSKYKLRNSGVNVVSKPDGTLISTNQARSSSDMQSYCKARGKGYHMSSYQEWCAILQLMIIEKGTFNIFPPSSRNNLAMCTYRGLQEICYNILYLGSEYVSGIEANQGYYRLWSRDGLQNWVQTTKILGGVVGGSGQRSAQSIYADSDDANYFISSSRTNDAQHCLLPGYSYTINTTELVARFELGNTSTESGPFSLRLDRGMYSKPVPITCHLTKTLSPS